MPKENTMVQHRTNNFIMTRHALDCKVDRFVLTTIKRRLLLLLL